MSDNDDEFQPAPSEEVIVEGMRRAARGVDDFDLDTQIAVAAARRDVAAAHGVHTLAAMWQRVLLGFDDVRRERAANRRTVEEMLSPVQVRPLTPEELDEVEWDD